MKIKTNLVIGVLIVFSTALMLCCGRTNIVVNTLEFPAGEILQVKGIDTSEYPSFEDAVILSGYDSLTIINSINNGTQVDGNQFYIK